MVERVTTGIPGLDELIEGGLPRGSVTLISGGAGTGKTIFCSQFLLQGLEQGEQCLFVTLEEEPEEILGDVKEFGWDFTEYEENGQFKISYLNPFSDSGGFSDHIMQYIEDIDADRVVIDSTSVMGMYDESPGKIRERLYNLIRTIRREGVTAILTAEIPRGDHDQISRYGVEEFVVDGVIVLRGLGVGGEMGRRLRIEKMRRTDIAEDIFPMNISDDGITVEEPEKGLNL